MNLPVEPPDRLVLHLYNKARSYQRQRDHKAARPLLVRVAKQALALTAHPDYLDMDVLMLKSVCMYSLEELENYRKARPSVLFEKGFEEGKDGPSKVGEGSVVTGTTLIRKSTIVSGASTLRSRGSDIRSIELRDKGKEREVEAEVIADRRVVSEPLSSLLPKFDFQRLNSGGMTQATSRTEADASARLPIDRTEDVIFPPRPSTPQPKLRKENEIISPSRNRGDVTQSSIPLAPLPGNQLRGVRSSARISSKTYRRSITIKPFPPEEYVINLYKQAFESKSIGNYPKAQTEFALCAKSILKLPEHPIYSRMNIVKLNRMLRECLSAVTALESLQSPNVVDQPSSPRATKRVADQAFRGCMLWYEDGIKHQTRDPSRAKKSFAKSVKMILAMPAHPCYSMMDQRLLSETAIACNEFLENRREGEKRKEATCVKRRSNAVYIKTPAARPTASARLAPEKPRVAAVERPEIRSAPLAKNVKPIASWPATSKRKLVIPEAVYEAFYNLGIVLPPLILAYNDINADVQTCGVLCGVWFDVKQALVITHILVPKQVKTKHSCIIREGDSDGLVEYQKRFNLLTLGWIQTHPTKPAELSCIDLHKQFGYQSIVPESILIILSPNCTPNSAVFQLSRLGMSVIDGCEMYGEHEHCGVGSEDLVVKVRDESVEMLGAVVGRRDVKIVALK